MNFEDLSNEDLWRLGVQVYQFYLSTDTTLSEWWLKLNKAIITEINRRMGEDY